MLDDDIAEVLPRLRTRAMLELSEDDEPAIQEIRTRYPRRSPFAIDDSVFDEGVSIDAPLVPETIPHPTDHMASITGRSKWQVKYLMAKAKLMLVEEENLLRRRELLDLQKREETLRMQE
jgi:hypothetical protein